VLIDLILFWHSIIGAIFTVVLRRYVMEPTASVFKRGWAMLGARPAAYVLAVIFPYVVIFGLTAVIGRLVVRLHPLAMGPVALWESMGWGTRLLIILAMTALAQVPLYVGARGVCRLALEQQRDIEMSMGAVLGDMLRFLPTSFLYFLTLGIATFLGSAFFVVPGLLIATYCALIIPAGIDGELGPFAAIRRGISLVKRVFGRVLGVYASYLGLVIAGQVVVNAFMAGDEGPGPGFFVLWVLWFVGLFLGIALVNIMFTLLYCEAREMDAAPLTAEAGSRAT
jgi:hypothetical protein